jgi:integrase
LLGIKPPKLDVEIVEPLTDDDLRALIKACSGLDPFRDRRDEAIIRVMLETGLRAGELVEMTISDTNLTAGEAIVRRGKGGKGRIIPLGAQSVRALDRYIRARRAHRLADTDALWLRDRGKAFSYCGLHRTLRMRADVAGVVNFHPHRLRHTAAHRWPAAGGSEGGLMSVAGWTRATRKPRPRSAPLPKRGS